MQGPFEQDGVPDDLKRMLASGRPLGEPIQAVDPRQLPFTYSEVVFRNCTHMWELVLDPEDPEKYAMFRLLIRDVPRGKLYSYGLVLETAEMLIAELQELIKARDEKMGATSGDPS